VVKEKNSCNKLNDFFARLLNFGAEQSRRNISSKKMANRPGEPGSHVNAQERGCRGVGVDDPRGPFQPLPFCDSVIITKQGMF